MAMSITIRLCQNWSPVGDGRWEVRGWGWMYGRGGGGGGLEGQRSLSSNVNAATFLLINYNAIECTQSVQKCGMRVAVTCTK